MLQELEGIVDYSLQDNSLVRMNLVSEVMYHGRTYPLYSFVIGTEDVRAPTIALIGGVHGLERIGSLVVINYLKSIIHQLSWDIEFRSRLNHFRIVAMPIVNPYGVENFRRSNGNGVDLMRNSPIEAVKDSTYKIYRGHNISNCLPWFRGDPNNMEIESKALIYLMEKELFPSKCALSLDFHSGFGVLDRLWYPYAKSNEPFSYINEAKNISQLFDQTHPYHVYKIESQSSSYTTHGDLWDHMMERYLNRTNKSEGIFIPWTLEMGSWNWLRKNPIQIFNRQGVFNPMVKHRFDRTMRRHFMLIQFFTQLVMNRSAWDHS
jgi:predicted deacylase